MYNYFRLASRVGDRSGSDRLQGRPRDFKGHIGWFSQHSLGRPPGLSTRRIF
jgi:hypothetical protein